MSGPDHSDHSAGFPVPNERGGTGSPAGLRMEERLVGRNRDTGQAAPPVAQAEEAGAGTGPWPPGPAGSRVRGVRTSETKAWRMVLRFPPQRQGDGVRPLCRRRHGARAAVHAGSPGSRLTVLRMPFFRLRAFVHFTNALITDRTASR